jgi:uncharacterized protein (DUF169 family)
LLLCSLFLWTADIAGCQVACVEFLDALASEGTEAMGVLTEGQKRWRKVAPGIS